jgi:hypothetical protein
MKARKPKRRASRLLEAGIALLLVVGSFGGSMPNAAPLDARDLASAAGAGFWNDPCTWDGFMTGAGIVIFANGSPSGLVTIYTGVMKAIYVDNCF